MSQQGDLSFLRSGVFRRGPALLARAASNRWARSIRIPPPALGTLSRELDLWADQGLQARFWWRDDDAEDASPALARLLLLRAKFGLPLAVAVIPAAATLALAGQLAGEVETVVLQHGWDHHNHASPGQPKAELAPLRDKAEVERQLGEGQAHLKYLFGDVALPVLVPPFNALAPGLVGAVKANGFRYVSLLGDFQGLGMANRNVHVDLIDWPAGRAEAPDRIARQAVAALRLRRFGLVERSAPIGIMTHHLRQDEEAWLSTEALLDCLAHHRAATFPSINAVFLS